jgi:hypothetical protein
MVFNDFFQDMSKAEKYTRQYKKLLQQLQFEGKIPSMFNFSLITTLHTYWALVNVEEHLNY